jgi:hypothetical protein
MFDRQCHSAYCVIPPLCHSACYIIARVVLHIIAIKVGGPRLVRTENNWSVTGHDGWWRWSRGGHVADFRRWHSITNGVNCR